MMTLAHAVRDSSAPAASFYARWIDHESWGRWSPDTEWVRVDGAVRQGARGILKPKGGPRVRFVVAELAVDRVYTDVTRMPGARLTFRHSVEPVVDGSRITVEVTIDGPLSRLWARTAFSGFATSVPEDLDRLIDVVEAS